MIKKTKTNTDREKIFIYYIPDKEFASRLYKEFSEFNKKI